VSEQPADSVASQEIRQELNEGPIKITFGTVVDEFPDMAKLVRVWELTRDGIEGRVWIEEHYGDAKLVQFEIPGTNFSLLVIGGEVRPLIKVSGPWEMWRIEGLDDFFQYVVAVNITERKVEFIAGGGDLRSTLIFDFTHELEMTFTQEGAF